MRLVVLPQFNEQLGVAMSGLLPYALILHFGFAVWMYGNTDMFRSEKFTLSEVRWLMQR